eukprot:gnl/TRDRNA2_/TRDRNA2_192442_c0_seq1.p1 gnl/TRDRNA2_/TRDRNA2_192442_c0~~gnl/TRDRNA2_/TRDRNA2_192442_c0_seq1.p1  ORF type:complete len:291 (-),score=55.77 gnl/TRDRNA2_/TRDRNA2_192442_c0_seq1:54-926(-)
MRMQASAHAMGARTAFEAEGTGGAGATCSVDGEMLWSKDEKHDNAYSLCYAPSLKGGQMGPSGGHMQCDKGSYFLFEAPRFCCRHPRTLIDGETQTAHNEVCGDVLAEFNQEDQQIRFVRGPSVMGSEEARLQLQKAGLGDLTPSPLAMAATQDKKWHRVQETICRGREGTLVAWVGGEGGKDGRTEFCPTRTPPVTGVGYASWQCDGAYTKEVRMHCCKVDGQLHCVPSLVDNTEGESCKCRGLPQGGSKQGGLKQKDASIDLSILVPLMPLLLVSRAAHRRDLGGQFL